MECVIILQPRPHFSHVRTEYGQGEVSLWASHEDGHGHGRGLTYLWTDLSVGLVQLLQAQFSRTYHNLVHGPRSSFRLIDI